MSSYHEGANAQKETFSRATAHKFVLFYLLSYAVKYKFNDNKKWNSMSLLQELTLTEGQIEGEIQSRSILHWIITIRAVFSWVS